MNTITVSKRDLTRKAKQLRHSGIVPGSVFGGSLPHSISVQMEESTARKLVRFNREGSKLKLELDGQSIPVQIKEKTVSTLSNEILHISFQALAADQKVNSVIHILLDNADKITASLERKLMEIPYASLPEDMIDTLTIDVDGMPVGTVMTAADLPALRSEKIELQIDPAEIIFRIVEKKNGIKPTEELS